MPITFRLYPEGRSLYFRAVIWPDRESVIRSSRRSYGPRGDDANLRAYCSPRRIHRTTPTGRLRLTPCLGEIHFSRDDIGAGIVAHEMTHAMLEWCRRVGHAIKAAPFHAATVDDSEERACLVLGELVRQFYCHAQRLKLY